MTKIGFFSLLILYSFACSTAQDPSDCYSEHLRFKHEQEVHFASEEESPLTEEDRMRFRSLNYFEFDERYCMEAEWVRTEGEEPFEMATSTERKPMYVKYGEVHFNYGDEQLKLSVYQSLSLKENEEYADYLFLPFNDMTNGVETYGGGRYMDLRIPENGMVLLDFNNSYHPYCAYNYKYSCPIPPEENSLNIAIHAGVRVGINGEKEMKH